MRDLDPTTHCPFPCLFSLSTRAQKFHNCQLLPLWENLLTRANTAQLCLLYSQFSLKAPFFFPNLLLITFFPHRLIFLIFPGTQKHLLGMSAESQVNSTQVQVGPHAFPSLTQCIQHQALCPEPPPAHLSPFIEVCIGSREDCSGTLCSLTSFQSFSVSPLLIWYT